MPVISMVRKDMVLGLESPDNRDLADFLAKTCVNRSCDMAFMKEPQRFLLGPSDKVREGKNAERV